MRIALIGQRIMIHLRLNIAYVFGCNPDYLPGPCRRKYFESHFKIVEKNLYYKAFRETFEGVIISLKKPSLNTQVPHKCLTFICTHEIPNTAVT